MTDEMFRKAEYYHRVHKTVMEQWTEGGMQDCWMDARGNLCIRYESGRWWHYKEREGCVEWW